MKFKINPELIDSIFEEKGSQYSAVRYVQWYGDTEEPNEDKYKMEIRRWRVDEDGNDLAMKGFTFMTEEGPNELTETLVENGYGNSLNLLKSILNRDDVKEDIKNFNGEKIADNDSDNTLENEYYDNRLYFESLFNSGE